MLPPVASVNAVTTPSPVEPPPPSPLRGPDLLPLFPANTAVTPSGELTIGGCTVSELAAEFGTPLYVVDEAGIRDRTRRFRSGLAERWPDSEVVFASKAFPCVAMYALAAQEGLHVDVAGGGELALALAAGVDPARIVLHGNAKTYEELAYAVENRVGRIVVDNLDDVRRLDELADHPQALQVRVIPGIDVETHESQATGGHESKFGLPPDQAKEALDRIAASPHLRATGVHAHVGSQILSPEPFGRAVEQLAALGTFEEYNLGGGLGARYTPEESPPSIAEYLDTITAAARTLLPRDARLLIEPGRSLVARSGVTLYTVVTTKRTGRRFVAVDGGMGDNLDPSLTGQRFEACVATRFDAPYDEVCELVGRHCESGDRIVSGVALQSPVPDDLVAVPVTGAYGYTLANNYNGARRPAVVFCADGDARLAVRRETYADLLRTHRPAIEE